MLDHPFYTFFFQNFFILTSIIMSEKSLKFRDKKISKSNFYKNIKPFKIDDIDVNKILISQKKYIAKKGFHINILLGMMIGYIKHFETK